MATVYKFEITSHWIAYHPNDMEKMIEKALYSCENEITVRNLEQEQANGTNTGQNKCHIQRVSKPKGTVCPECKGKGKIKSLLYSFKCDKCNGTGQTDC